jgi:hypothetical protein
VAAFIADNSENILTGIDGATNVTTMMVDNPESTAVRRPVPYYGSWASFVRALKALKEQPQIPKRINPRSLGPLLGEEATRTSTNLIAMGWVDENDHPSQDFVALVGAFGEESWKKTLTEVVRKAYSFVPDDWGDLTKATLHDAFVAYTGREAKVLTSAETFFLSLALECGINIPDRLYLRAARAHAGRRSKTEEEADEEFSEVQSGEVVNEPRVEPKRVVTKDKDHSFKPGKTDTWFDQVLELTTLVGKTGMSDAEKEDILTIIRNYGKRMASA